MKHIRNRILALLTSGAAAAGMVSAMPFSAGAEDFVRGKPRKVIGGEKLIENIEEGGEYFYYRTGTDGEVSCTVLEDHDYPRSCSTYAEFHLSLPDAWTVNTAANRLGQIVSERAGHPEYEYKKQDLYGTVNNTKTDFYFGIYDPNRDDDFYGIIADLYDYLPQLGFEINGLAYYAEYGIVNQFQPGGWGGYSDLGAETVAQVNAYLQSIDSALSLSEDNTKVVRKNGENSYEDNRYYPELAEKFGIWPDGARTCAFRPGYGNPWKNAENAAQELPDTAVSAAKDKYRMPDYCASFELNLTDTALKALAEKIGVPVPAAEQPLDSSLVAEALGTGFAAKILPEPEGWEATGGSGYTYKVQLNSMNKGTKDGAARLIAYLKQYSTADFTIRADSADPVSTLAQIGDFKRIDGLHDYYAAKGNSIAPDKQFYYDAEKTGILYEVTRAGSSGMTLTLPVDGEADAARQKAHIAALAVQYFGAGCRIECRPIYMAFDSFTPTEPVFAAAAYEIRLPKQSLNLQADAEKLYRALLEEGITVDSCWFYPEFGWVNSAIPEGYPYNAAQFDAISAFLTQNEPDFYLKADSSQTTMQIRSKNESNPRAADAVYAEVFESLGYWPDHITYTDGAMHGLGTDLKQTVSAEKRVCPWQSPEDKDGGKNFYANLRYYAESGSAYGNSETYTSGGSFYTFRTHPGSLAFRLSQDPYSSNSTFKYQELSDLTKKHLGTQYADQRGYLFYTVSFTAEEVKAENIEAYKQALADTGLLEAFYMPGDVASVNIGQLTSSDALYYHESGMQGSNEAFDAIKAWLTEYRTDCTYEEGVVDTERAFGKTDSTYFKVTPKTELTTAELVALAGDIDRLSGLRPEMLYLLTNDPVYAVRNNCYVPAAEAGKGEPCEWLSTYIGENGFEPGWSDRTKFDAKGMFGSAETYIYTFEDSATMTVFDPLYLTVGCYSAALNCTNETLERLIQARVPSYFRVSIEPSGLILIQDYARNCTELPEEEVQSIFNALTKDELISAFFRPGDVAAVRHYGLASRDALLYNADRMYNGGEVLQAMQNWLEANRPGYTAEVVTDTALSDGEAYIKVTPKEKISDAEMFALAADLFKVTGEHPEFSYILPNVPEYAVRNDRFVTRGDMNADGRLDVSDAVMTARYIAEDKELVVYDNGIRNADVTGDGKVNTDDLTMMLRAIAKQIKL